MNSCFVQALNTPHWTHEASIVRSLGVCSLLSLPAVRAHWIGRDMMSHAPASSYSSYSCRDVRLHDFCGLAGNSDCSNAGNLAR